MQMSRMIIPRDMTYVGGAANARLSNPDDRSSPFREAMVAC